MLRKDQKILDLDERIEKAFSTLSKDHVHILFFSYRFSFHNLRKNWLLLSTKIMNALHFDPSIDHVAHISRFSYDEYTARYRPKLFEANTERGMEETDLKEKLRAFKGKVYIHTLPNPVNKVAARAFEDNFYAVPYSKIGAASSGLDVPFLSLVDRIKTSGGFCSWLVALFMANQGYNLEFIQGGNPAEITPTDLFKAFGHKTLFFEAK